MIGDREAKRAGWRHPDNPAVGTLGDTAIITSNLRMNNAPKVSQSAVWQRRASESSGRDPAAKAGSLTEGLSVT